MGLGEFCQHVERLDVDLLIEQFTPAACRTAPSTSRSIRAVGADYARRLAEQEQILLERVLG